MLFNADATKAAKRGGEEPGAARLRSRQCAGEGKPPDAGHCGGAGAFNWPWSFTRPVRLRTKRRAVRIQRVFFAPRARVSPAAMQVQPIMNHTTPSSEDMG